MSSFLSYEESIEYLDYYSKNTKRFAQEAIDSGICKFLRGSDTVIIVEKPELKELNDEAIGIYLSITRDSIWAFVAVNDSNHGIRDWINLGQYNTSENFESVVNKTLIAAGTCNYCKNHVGYKDIHRVSFAGKSCTACLPTARAKDEPPGWYN